MTTIITYFDTRPNNLNLAMRSLLANIATQNYKDLSTSCARVQIARLTSYHNNSINSF